MFFEHSRSHFFKPVTGKYREQVVACLSQLYLRLYRASQADFGSHLKRDDVIEVFHEAVVRTPLLNDEIDDLDNTTRNHRDQAAWIFNILIEHGWLERQVDEVSMSSSFHFSREGRSFTEPFVNGNQTHRTRHRNTRSTYNSLKAFVSEMDIYDLLDSWDHSERIISDFSEVITELEERRNLLVKDMESQLLVQKASEEFFDFMEKRFQPDLSVKLTADGVEKYRERIVNLLDQIRGYDRSQKADLERRLRQLLPDLIQDNQSVLFTLLDNIEQRIRSASDIIVPQLRRAIQGFTKRADVILRQLSYLSAQNHDDVIERCKILGSMDSKSQDDVLTDIGYAMSSFAIGYVDPGQTRLQAPRKMRIPANFVDETIDVDESARHDIHIQSMLDQAFYVNSKTIQNYLLANFKEGNTIDSANLPVTNAIDLLALSHIIEAGAQSGLSSEYRFHIEPDPRPVIDNPFFDQLDRFQISLVDQNQES